MFKLLREETRLRILLQLKDGEKCVHDIADALDADRSNISHSYKDGLEPEEIASRYPTITHEAVTARLVDRRYTGTVVVTGSGISS